MREEMVAVGEETRIGREERKKGIVCGNGRQSVASGLQA